MLVNIPFGVLQILWVFSAVVRSFIHSSERRCRLTFNPDSGRRKDLMWNQSLYWSVWFHLLLAQVSIFYKKKLRISSLSPHLVLLLQTGRQPRDQPTLLVAFYLLSFTTAIGPVLYSWQASNVAGHTKKTTVCLHSQKNFADVEFHHHISDSDVHDCGRVNWRHSRILNYSTVPTAIEVILSDRSAPIRTKRQAVLSRRRIAFTFISLPLIDPDLFQVWLPCWFVWSSLFVSFSW